jgi:serine phosphatase RsbU (regulator of sigma subunit)
MTRAELILIVDDEPLNVSLLEQELDDIGYHTSAASSGPQALKLIEANAPDLVLLDIMMPGMDGFEVLSRIKAHDTWRHIPVVIISAIDDMPSIIRGIKLGAEDYLSKPFDPVLLQARLSSSLERKRLRDAEQAYLKGMERELQIGRQIQLDFLPDALPTPAGWDIAAYFQAAREVAGDFYDVFALESQHRVGIMVGDVCDKGVGAALYMALFRSLLRAASSQIAADESDEALLRHAIETTNNYIAVVHEQATMFTTLFYGVLDPATGRLTYVNAGQEPALVVAGRAIKASLNATAPAIGLFTDPVFATGWYDLEPGDTLLIYSDGVPDAMNEAGDPLGVAVISSIAAGRASGTAQAMVDRVAEALFQHIGTADQFDDITLMAIRRAVS